VPASIERARPEDLPEILGILQNRHLPPDGLPEHLATMLVARDNGRVVGSAALEVYDDGVLLRSVAVVAGREHQGIGHELTNAALKLAATLRAPAVFLLTTTADAYFPRFGFERIERSAVPTSVQASVEFTSACPSAATVMRKPLST
jgi:amino-acid N-acetyltransferase